MYRLKHEKEQLRPSEVVILDEDPEASIFLIFFIVLGGESASAELAGLTDFSKIPGWSMWWMWW